MSGLCVTCHARPIRYNKIEACHTCYMRDHYYLRSKAKRNTRKTDWFDWVAVNRAWLSWTGQPQPPIGRNLSSAERLHLLYHAMAQGETSATTLRFLIRAQYPTAKRLVEQLATGAVTVYERDECGQAGQPMPPL